MGGFYEFRSGSWGLLMLIIDLRFYNTCAFVS